MIKFTIIKDGRKDTKTISVFEVIPLIVRDSYFSDESCLKFIQKNGEEIYGWSESFVFEDVLAVSLTDKNNVKFIIEEVVELEEIKMLYLSLYLILGGKIINPGTVPWFYKILGKLAK